MKVTWFDANSWLIESDDIRILIDPWLIGDLVFESVPWLVRGIRPESSAIPQNIDLILLSQGLADHAHPETLRAMDRSIPVVASPDGAKVAESLGYASVKAIDHGEQLEIDERLQIEAFVGAPVGPMKRENAYVLSFLTEGVRVYYEPHGYPDSQHLKSVEPVDVAITPMADQTLMGVAPVIRGSIAAPKIAELLRPQVMLPTADAEQVTYEGLISPTLATKGGAAKMRSRLSKHLSKQGSPIKVIQPTVGEAVELELTG